MTPTEKILQLIYSIPALADKLDGANYRPAKFDPDAFYRLMAGWSRGERICGSFVLYVWNPAFLEEKGEPFYLHEAVQVLTQTQRDAIAAWVKNPIFP